MKSLVLFLTGCVFSLGLCISGLVEPRKVLAFLDLFGRWDPSLIFTMGGGVLVAAASHVATRQRRTSVLGDTLQLPTNTALDARLVAGSLLFGVGWGLAGVCPGPAIVNLGFLSFPAAVFVAAMLFGMALHVLVDHAGIPRSRTTADA